jgi:hypothetical protein
MRAPIWLFTPFLVLGWTMSATMAQQKPTVPITRFPGANPSVACTPGRSIPETPAIHRQVLKFLNEAQTGRFDKQIVGRWFPPDVRGTKSFFSQIGPVEELTFRHGNSACSKDVFGYDYHVVGRHRIANLSFTIIHGRIEGYAQIAP